MPLILDASPDLNDWKVTPIKSYDAISIERVLSKKPLAEQENPIKTDTQRSSWNIKTKKNAGGYVWPIPKDFKLNPNTTVEWSWSAENS